MPAGPLKRVLLFYIIFYTMDPHVMFCCHDSIRYLVG